MRKLLFAAALLLAAPLCFDQSQQPKATDLRSVLLEQLHSTHDKAEWFVPADTAVVGLTAEQARWVPKSDAKAGQMHSVAQLVAHLIYWNERSLTSLKGEKPPPSPATTRRPSSATTSIRSPPPSGLPSPPASTAA